MSVHLRSIIVVLAVVATCGSALTLSEPPPSYGDAVWDSVYAVTSDSSSQYLAYGSQYSLATDTAGNVHVVWYDYRTSHYQIGYRRFDRATGLWLPETILTDHSSNCYRPTVACDESGDVHVAWYILPGGSEAGIWYKRFDAATQAWQPDTLIHFADSGMTASYPSLAGRPGGDNIHLVWVGILQVGGGSRVGHKELIPGAGWSAVTDLGAGYSPSVAVDGRNGVHVVWELSGPYLRQRIGGVWQPADRFASGSAYRVAVAVDTAGTAVHAAWHGKTETSDEYEVFYQCRTVSGWSPLARVSREPDFDQYYPSISCGPDGRCDIVWEGSDSLSGSHERIYHATRFGTGVWTRPEPLTPASLDASYPCVAIDRNSGLHLVWYDSRNGSRDVRYMRGSHCQSDVASFAIVSPPELVLPRQPHVPEITVGNQGLLGAPAFRVHLRLDSSGITVYRDSAEVVSLASGDTQNVNLREWTSGGGPIYDVTAWVVLTGDENPRNDTFRRTGGVVSWPNGWREAEHAPGSVKRGGWMARMAANGLIYLAEGDESDFQSFDALRDTWVERAHFPLGLEGKVPKRGAKGIADGGRYIYATKGNNTVGFWAYDVVTDLWSQLAGVPLGPTNKKVKGGTDVEYVVKNDTGYVYLLKGYRNEFWRYSTRSGQWELLQSAPVGANLKWGEGSWLVYDGDHTLYAHKARLHELWSYNLLNDSWSTRQLKGMPVAGRTGRSKKSRDGGSGVLYRGAIYALKGGNTQEFWRYVPTEDNWYELDTVPRGGAKRKVSYGGDLVSFGHDTFFASKGRKSHEIWRYVLPLDLRLPQSEQRREVATEDPTPATGRQVCPVVPTVIRGVLFMPEARGEKREARSELLDISGREVMNLRPGANDVSRLSPGVYFIRKQLAFSSPYSGTENGARSTVHVTKVIIQR